MKTRYEDVLAECLALSRNGANPQRLIDRHPEYAERLRADLSTAAAARSVAAQRQAPSSAANRRFLADLAAQREANASPGTRRFAWLNGLAPRFVFTSTAAILLIALALYFGPDGDQAVEASFEGVVVENAGGVLTLQTPDGLQSVRLDQAASVIDEGGTAVDLLGIEPGRVLLIDGVKGPEAIMARRVSLRAVAELSEWCRRNPAQCEQVELRLTQQADGCGLEAATCRTIAGRAEELRQRLGSLERLRDLRSNCGTQESPACLELRDACAADTGLCDRLDEWRRQRSEPQMRPQRFQR